MTLLARLILGCARLTGGASARDAEALVRAALDAGITHVDTAPSYGMGTAELVVGQALRGFGGPVAVTAKLGSARDPHAGVKSWLRRAKRALAPGGGGVWQHSDPPMARITAPSGNDFRGGAMQASLELSRERLGRIDYLLLHDVSAGEVTTPLLTDLASLAAGVAAAPGYASYAQWDGELDERFPRGSIAQCALVPPWLTGAATARQRPLFLHSVVKAGAALRAHSPEFAQRLEQAAQMVGTGNRDADRIGALYAGAAVAVPDARLIIASSHRPRLDAVLRAIARLDKLGTATEVAKLLISPSQLTPMPSDGAAKNQP